MSSPGTTETCKRLQTETPAWEVVWDRPNARRQDGARDVWSVYRDPLGTAEGFSLIWVWSTLLTLRQQARRHRNIATATEALTGLRRRILGARSRDPRWRPYRPRSRDDPREAIGPGVT